MRGSGFGFERDSGNFLRMILAEAVIGDFVSRALREDLADGLDLTSQLCLPNAPRGLARITAREAGVIAGLPLAEHAFGAQDSGAEISLACGEGEAVELGQLVMSVRAEAKALLAAERTALNFLQRLSGIASMTRAFVDAVAGTGAVILETRKTAPTLRALDKYAVRVGGGQNHRMGLYDQVLIKENHIALAAPASYAETVARAVQGASAAVIAEARSLDEARMAVESGAAVVMLDNMEPSKELAEVIREIRQLAAKLGRQVAIEASGGINLGNVRGYADCGVDRISVGALTHSVSALDLSMLVEARD